MKRFLATLCRLLLLCLIIQALIFSSLGYADETQAAKVTASVALGGDGGGGGGDTPTPDLFTGSLSYQIPIEVPLGRNGMEPGLAMKYNSGNSNSWLGVGWELEVGAIERSTRFGVNTTPTHIVL